MLGVVPHLVYARALGVAWAPADHLGEAGETLGGASRRATAGRPAGRFKRSSPGETRASSVPALGATRHYRSCLAVILEQCDLSVRMTGMRRALASTDDRLLEHLHAPPDLGEGMHSLTYWHQRRQRLSWYRLRARREAGRMIVRWEQRVRDAMFSQPGVPITVRASAGLLVTRIRIGRWSRRAVVTGTIAFGVALVAAPFVAALVLLIHAL